MTEAVKIYFSKAFCEAKNQLGLTNKQLVEMAKLIRSNPKIGKPYSLAWPMFRDVSVTVQNKKLCVDYVYIEELNEIECALISEVPTPPTGGKRDALWYLEVGSRLVVVADRLLKLLT